MRTLTLAALLILFSPAGSSSESVAPTLDTPPELGNLKAETHANLANILPEGTLATSR